MSRGTCVLTSFFHITHVISHVTHRRCGTGLYFRLLTNRRPPSRRPCRGRVRCVIYDARGISSRGAYRGIRWIMNSGTERGRIWYDIQGDYARRRVACQRPVA
eukprot:2793718-Pyramimonas_sp.AAC.1